jgi:hypothetical protein
MAQNFIRPNLAEITDSIVNPALLRSDSEQQQQQQQQQQGTIAIRRYLNAESLNPEEEVVTRLTTEIKTINRLMPRGEVGKDERR